MGQKPAAAAAVWAENVRSHWEHAKHVRAAAAISDRNALHHRWCVGLHSVTWPQTVATVQYSTVVFLKDADLLKIWRSSVNVLSRRHKRRSLVLCKNILQISAEAHVSKRQNYWDVDVRTSPKPPKRQKHKARLFVQLCSDCSTMKLLKCDV